MDFYTSLFAGTLAFLIITLIVVGYYMSMAKKKQTYPPSVADCPDYYSLDVSACVIGKNIFASEPSDVSCNIQNFNDAKYKVPGTDFKSGLCAK